MVARVRDEQIPGVIHCNTAGEVKCRAGGLTSVSGKAGATITGHRRDDTAGRHLSNTAVASIDNMKISCGIQRNARRLIECRASGSTSVSGEASVAITDDGRDDTVRSNLSNAVIDTVAKVEISWGVQHEVHCLI